MINLKDGHCHKFLINHYLLYMITHLVSYKRGAIFEALLSSPTCQNNGTTINIKLPL